MQSTSGPTSAEIEHLVSLMRQGHYTSTETIATKITERFPEYGFSWKILGVSLLLQGRTVESLAPMQKASELLPNDADLHLNLGIVYNDLDRLVDAETSYRRALEIKPDFANGHNNLGNTLRKARRLKEAEASFRRALKIIPNFVEAQINLGYTLYDQDRLDEAEISFSRALEIKPDFAEAQHYLGRTLKKQRRLDEALVHYRLALKSKGDWKKSLSRLTNPLILDADMMLMSSNPAVSSDEVGQQTSTLQNPSNYLQTHTMPLNFGQELQLPESNSSFNDLSKLLGKSEILTDRHEALPHVEAAEDSKTRNKKQLRIILIYPPPYQIPSYDGEIMMGMPFGPTKDRNDRDLDGDFRTITYGLLTIAAQAKRAGYNVSVYNLSTCPWKDVVKLIAETEADIYGISSFSANRRGMGAVAKLIRQYHPQVHITVGGPFVTVLPLETLRYYQEIDTVVIGEGEETFMELLECLEGGRPAVNIPGTAWRNGKEITIGPTRPRINDLDALASPFDYFTSHIVMTSRGCPSKCSFCGSFTIWRRKVRFQSVQSCLDTFKKALVRQPIPFLAIKDDTFTAHRQRALAICDAIIESKLNFLWSCDTRVDSLNDELLRKMRLAGCQMISLGVESGSPEILKTMNKETSPEMVLEATRIARKYGMYVGYYMILINRGETPETIQQSVDLIKVGRPSWYSFSTLTFYPGTEDWEMLCEKQGLTPDVFFNNDFKDLNVAKNRQTELTHVWLQVQCDIGTIHGFNYTVEECEAIIDRLPNLHTVYVELANAYFRAGRYDEAMSTLNRAEKLGFPISNIIDNLRACINVALNDIGSALSLLESASQIYPSQIVMKNLISLRAWANAPVRDRGKRPLLNDSVQALDFFVQQLQPAFLTPL